MADPAEIMLNYLISVGLFVVALIFLYQTRKHSRRAHELTLALFCGAFGQLFLTIGLFNQLGDETISLYSTILGLFIYSFLFVFMFLHFEYEHRTEPSSPLLAILMILLGSILLALLLAGIDYGQMGLSLATLGLYILYGIALFVFSHSFIVSLQTSKQIPERQQIIETVSLASLLIGSIVYVVGSIFNEPLLNILGFSPITLGDFLIVLGLFLMAGNYLSNIHFLYRLPVPIHQIIVFNEAGMSVYSKKVQTKGLKHLNIQEALFAGTITAITSLIRETLGTGSRLRTLDAGNKHIYLETGNKVTGLVITDKGTRFLTRSLKQLMLAIPAELVDAMNQVMVKFEEIEVQMNEYVKRAFPYVEFVT